MADALVPGVDVAVRQYDFRFWVGGDEFGGEACGWDVCHGLW
jgi:hypothetical protein